jgi:phosphoribosylpyrophosphate synthetase
VDDIVDTAGTLCKAAEVLMEHGAKEVHSYITHGVLSNWKDRTGQQFGYENLDYGHDPADTL